MEEYALIAKNHQIICYNQQNLRLPATGLVELTECEENIKGRALMELLWEPLPTEERFNDWGAPFSERMYEVCLQRIPVFSDEADIEVKKGIVVTNTAIRVLPTMQGNYRAGQERELDRFAKGLLKLGEGVLIYTQDKTKTWYFVQSRQFYGWVLQKDIAFAESKYWEQYMTERQFVQFLGSRQALNFIEHNGCQNREKILMGTKFVLHDTGREYFIVSLPRRDEQGKLYMLPITIPRGGEYYAGEPGLTIQNIKAQGSKMLGEPYDWGGKHGYRDCTGLISDLYLVFGVYFAGNSTMQAAQVGVRHLAKNCTLQDKKRLLHKLMPGTVLYMPGHAMLYWGYEQGKYRILHSVYQIGLQSEDGVLPHKIKRVVMGDLEQLRTDGKALLQHWDAYWEPRIISCN